MKADNLLNWDKVDLANLLAEKVADAEDLLEAHPDIEKVGAMEEGALDEYIESNWELILSHFDLQDLTEWMEEKDYEQEWEDWKNECVVSDNEYAEYKNDEYYWSLVELMFGFRNLDLAEQRGYFSKFRKS